METSTLLLVVPFIGVIICAIFTYFRVWHKREHKVAKQQARRNEIISKLRAVNKKQSTEGKAETSDVHDKNIERAMDLLKSTIATELVFGATASQLTPLFTPLSTKNQIDIAIKTAFSTGKPGVQNPAFFWPEIKSLKGARIIKATRIKNYNVENHLRTDSPK